MKSFTVNGVTYTAKDFNFNTVCDLEDLGVSLSDLGNKPMAMIRAYLTICSGRDAEFAGEQIEQHIINGGNFEDMMQVISEKMEESGFFRALQSRTENNPTEGEETQTAKKNAKK